ncbi:MAG: hypothetical protein ABSC94_10745 [Polyangiaceae bacterium]|jgi:hypothetical protein
MSKLILLGLVMFTAIAPILVSTGQSSKRRLRTVQVLTFLLAFVWAYACRVWYPSLVPLE